MNARMLVGVLAAGVAGWCAARMVVGLARTRRLLTVHAARRVPPPRVGLPPFDWEDQR